MTVKLHLIPGTMCTNALWQPMQKCLPASVQLVCLDIPNHKTFDELADYYLQITQQQKLNLIGFSLGGYIAGYFASRIPQRLNRLMIIANSPAALPETELLQRQETIHYVRQYGYAGISRARAKKLLDQYQPDRDHISTIQAMDNALGEATLLSQYEYLSQRDNLLQPLSQLEAPCSFYCSAKDPLVNHAWLHQLAELNRQINITTTSGSGHMLPLEKPAELAELIMVWLAQDD